MKFLYVIVGAGLTAWLACKVAAHVLGLAS